MDTVFLLLVLLVAVLLSGVYAVHTLVQLIRLHCGAVPFVQSDRRIIQTVLDEALLPRSGMILDLGCGDGALLFALERHGYEGPLIGYEHSLHPWASGALWAKLRGSSVRILRRDAAQAPLREARAVYLFLLTGALIGLRTVLESSLRPGTVIISAEFAVPEWQPVRIIHAPGVTSKTAPIYVYRAGESYMIGG